MSLALHIYMMLDLYVYIYITVYMYKYMSFINFWYECGEDVIACIADLNCGNILNPQYDVKY